jgi:oxalate decarboxylase/phosphoglucose isomerase-like protein (cupin superfamily)
MGKYDDLVFTIPQENHNWYGFASPRGFFRGTTMMPKARLYMDFSAVIKELPMEVPHTHHAVDEYLVFTGADMNNFFEFDAEVDIWLGDDPERMELFSITQPVIVRVPPKLYHCPVNFKRIKKPIMFSAVYLDGDWSKITPRINAEGVEEFSYDGAGIRRCALDRSNKCVYCGKCFSEIIKKAEAAPENNLDKYYEMAKLPRTGKFDKYVYAYKPEHHGDPNFLTPRSGFRGESEMEESNLWYLNDVVLRECTVGETHMHHAVEEYLYFTGADITRFFEFDAEIEIRLGNDPENMETYAITKPTVIRVPPNIWHGPVNFKRVGAPINFMPFYPSGNYARVVRELRADGTPVYIHKGADEL